MQLCFFEDDLLSTFHPLTLTRPVDNLRIGILSISKKWEHALETANSCRILRPELKGVFTAGTIDHGEKCIWINSRYLPTDNLIEEVNSLSSGQYLQFNDTVIAACVDGLTSQQWIEDGAPNFNNLFVLETTHFLSIENIWDLFQLNGRQIVQDLKLMGIQPEENKQALHDLTVEKAERVYVQEDATIEAGCVLNATKGPIFIGKNATIMAGSYIRGPVAICEGATIKMGTRIYEDTTVGPVCKVGGEVNNCIFHSYSNKAHEGFMGNSLIGQWCNIGADTNTSNLKNNYSTIRITRWEDREEIETRQQFFGAVLGDHTKTAINTQLNTGTICGVSCNIFSNDFPPKFIPSFSWVGSNVIQTYRMDKAFDAMEAMMARRDVELTENYRQMMESIFEDRSG